MTWLLMAYAALASVAVVAQAMRIGDLKARLFDAPELPAASRRERKSKAKRRGRR